MLKTLFKPFFKRFLGLFFSMAFVSMLAIALLCTFGSTIVNLRNTYRSYLNKYGNIDEQITTSFVNRNNLVEVAEGIEGVEDADARFTMDAFMKKENGRTIVARVFSFNESENRVFKRYVLESVPKLDEEIDISVCRKFATNNGIKLGDTIQLGYFKMFIGFHVNEIIETAEGIYPRANDYIWSDNQDFGYLYVDELELNQALLNLAGRIQTELSTNPSYKEYYEKAIASLGITVPDFRTIEQNYVSTFANQLLVRNEADFPQEVTMNKIAAALNDAGVDIKTKTLGDNLPYRVYMANAMKQLTVATIFLPVFFYSVTMIIVGLFVNQIIKQMTVQIGIMSSIGIDRRSIVTIFLLFSLFMSLLAGILGSFLGYGLNLLMTSILIKTYSIPIIPSTIHWLVDLVAILALVLFAEIATLISCTAIFRITPKDAVIANEAKRKPVPKPVEKIIEKSPMNIKLGINSIAQNPRRFLVSMFSIFSSIVLIMLSSLFFVSKEEMISQSVDRRLNFDCQVYFTERIEDEALAKLEGQSFIKEMEDCYYTYLEAKAGSESIYIECLAIDTDAGALINIPEENGSGRLSVTETGLILPKSDANRLGVSKGGKVTINGVEVVVSEISFQYFHPLTYMSKTQMDQLGASGVVTTVLADVNDQSAFLGYLSENYNQCLTVFTESLAKDLRGIFDAVNIFIYIMIGFSLGMSFIILTIMSQNALMERQRQLSVMRAIGFTILDISNLWTFESILQLGLASLIAVPSSFGFAILLFSMCSSSTQIYPFIMDWRVVLIAIGFSLFVVVACHLLSMISIKKWNLADNTRSRE